VLWGGEKPSKTKAAGVAWESLIGIGEDEPSIAAAKPKYAEVNRPAADLPVRRPPWLWPTVAIGVFSLAFIVA
jgi:hypothetical protein